jgi:hypothetical protein
MPRTRIPITLGDWKVLTETVTPETRQGRAYLEHAHAKLEGFFAEVLRLTAERDDHQARKQEATRRINQLVDEGRRLASSLRQALKISKPSNCGNATLPRFPEQRTAER